MLEESRMDKKSINRSSQPQPRATAIDCKKSSDPNHKPWLRNNKKREGTGNAPKNEQYRKNAPTHRGRGQIDRRPRPRGDTSTFNMGGTQIPGIGEEDEPEIGSVFVPGSKKHNLNHLLNFMYPTRGTQEHGLESRGVIPKRPILKNYMHRLDNDLYLRANCQFVLKEGGDYKANFLDPDVPIKWEQIEEIVVRSTGRSECPICLGTPAAGRVSHCGHVYCWACVLHYAATHDKQPPPCPVCAMPLQVNNMKPTRMLQWSSSGEEVTMRLVRRLRGSITVEAAPPRGQISVLEAMPVLPLESVNIAPYCKFFTASKQQVRDIVDREMKELNDQIMAEIDTTEIEYLEQALGLLKKKAEELNMQYEQPQVVEELKYDSVPIVYENHATNENKIDWFDITEDALGTESIQEVENLAIAVAQSNLNPDAPDYVQNDVDDNLPEEFPLTGACNEIESVSNEDELVFTDIDKLNQAKYFYFYQAEDGQQIFLNSLNVRVLNASWGTLAAAPPIIRGRVLHRETLSLVEQTRKHMPYTAHLPLYCAFDIVELDLQPPYVTGEALKSFTEEIERRARIRARQERDERRRERAYHRAMEGPPKPDFSSELLFPPAASSYGSPPLNDPPLLQTDEASPSTSATTPPGLSFAKMAGTSGTWRVRKSAPPLPAQPVEQEGQAPRTLNLSDAIEAALHAAPAKGGKKKKSKQKVLFVTGMQHSS